MSHLLVNIGSHFFQPQFRSRLAKELRDIGHIEHVHADENIQRRLLEHAEQIRSLTNRQLLRSDNNKINTELM